MASEDYLLWIAAADELGLFWTLDDAPLSAQEAGVALRMNPDTVGGMLALLTSLGFLDVTDGRFSLNALSRTYLLPHSLYYKGPWLDLLRKRPRLTYDDLCEALRRDVTLPTVRGYQSYWVEHEAQGDPDLTRRFALAMHAMNFPSAVSTATCADFGGVERLLDLAGDWEA